MAISASGKASSGSGTSKSSSASGKSSASSGTKGKASAKASVKAEPSRALSGFGKSMGESLSGIGKAVREGVSASVNTKSGASRGVAGTEAKTAKNKADVSGLKGNAKSIAEVLSDKGWSKTQINAALGRLQQESSLNPKAIAKNDAGKGKHSYGIAQVNKSRYSNLKNYAAALGADWEDVKVQAGFIHHEMFGDDDERVAGKYGAASESYAGKKMAAAKTVEDGTIAMMDFERPVGYTRKSPTSGHGYSNTVNYANSFAESLGLDGESAIGSAAQTKRSNPGDPFGLSGALESVGLGGLAQTLGIVNPSEDENGFRDPYVSSVEGRRARGEDGTSGEKKTPGVLGNLLGDEGGGVQGVVGSVKDKNPIEAGKKVLGAVRDPIGFAIDTIGNLINGSDSMNTPGPEGEGGDYAQNGLFSGILNGEFGSSGASGFNDPRDREGQKKKIINPAEAAPAVAAVEPVKKTRKPFEWSLLG